MGSGLLRRVSLAIALFAASIAAAPAATGGATAVNGTIRGRVELRQSPPDLAPRPRVGDVSMPRAHDPTDRRRSVVYLETAPRAAFDQRDEPRAKLDQRNEAFAPHVGELLWQEYSRKEENTDKMDIIRLMFRVRKP